MPEGSNERYIEIILLILILAIGFTIRLSPFLIMPDIPYGMNDAAFHYQMASLVSEGFELSQCRNCIYYHVFKGDYFYPPLMHHLNGYVSWITGINIQYIIYPINGIVSTLFILATYLFVKKAIGIKPAFAAAIFIMASKRDIYSLYWGQWPSIYSLIFIPLCLYYAFDVKKRPDNMIPLTFLWGLSLMAYPTTAFYILLVIIIYLLATGLPKINPDLIVTCSLISVIFLMSFVSIVDRLMGQISSEKIIIQEPLNHLMSWTPDYLGGYPEFWVDYTFIYTVLIFPIIAIGLIAMISSIKKDIMKLVLIMIITQYIFTHVYILGISSPERSLRSMNQESFIFAMILAIAITATSQRRIFQYVTLGIFALMMISNLGFLANLGQEMFPIGYRPTPNEMKAFKWIKQNIPYDADIILQGGNGLVTNFWGTALTNRRIISVKNGKYEFQNIEIPLSEKVYVLLDMNLMSLTIDEARAYQLRLLDIERQLSNQSVQVFLHEDIKIMRMKQF